MKAYRREVMDGVPLRPDWHRYMVVIAAADGFRLDVAAGAALPAARRRLEVQLAAHSGRRLRPAQRSGSSSASAGSRCSSSASRGAALFVIGLLAGIVALVLRFGYGIGFRPLLNLVETMVISGIVLFGFGLLGEMVAGLQEETRAIARALDRLDKPDLRD